jgi:hypothetical protein
MNLVQELLVDSKQHIVCEGGACGVVSDTAVWAGQQTRDTLIGSVQTCNDCGTLARAQRHTSYHIHTSTAGSVQRGCVGVLG